MTELIIAEKPAASLKLAQALAEGKIEKTVEKGASFYSFKRKGKEIIVGCAVGHLFTLTEKEKGYKYPVFDIEWKPTYEVNKTAAFSKKYLDLLRKISKRADSFTVACDYDIEGEVIGLNVVRFVCGKKDANRMKFSTLTKQDLIKAYENKANHLDWGQANAGDTRHRLDWYYGINLSRALIGAIKSTGRFRVMSIGRVQGPALKIIVDREKEIQAFKPVPFWQIELLGKVKKGDITAWHIKDKFLDKKEAEAVLKKVKGKDGKISSLEKTQFEQLPLIPFDLTTLQTESYRCFGINPKETLALAQELYLAGLISYPRTSSQKLPAAIGFKKILSNLSKQNAYSLLAKEILKTKLIPREGAKTDSAHPAIYPTGEVPETLNERVKKVYDLVVKRFLTVFSEFALRETVKVEIDVNKEIFVAKGTRTIKEGWHKFYQPYVSLKEEELPPLAKGDDVKVKKITPYDRETQPPKRYTPSSIIRALEKRNLGTKATRATIVDTLYQRGYVKDQALAATQLGIKTIDTLEKYSPEITDDKLTRHFEEEMEEIREAKKKEGEVLDEAKDILVKILKKFKQKEKEIGEELSQAEYETRKEANLIGKCPKCKKNDLRVLFSRKSKKRFIACAGYPKCKTTFSLPQKGLVKSLNKDCPHCGYPMIVVINKGRRPWQLCINRECSGKVEK